MAMGVISEEGAEAEGGVKRVDLTQGIDAFEKSKSFANLQVRASCALERRLGQALRVPTGLARSASASRAQIGHCRPIVLTRAPLRSPFLHRTASASVLPCTLRDSRCKAREEGRWRVSHADRQVIAQSTSSSSVSSFFRLILLFRLAPQAAERSVRESSQGVHRSVPTPVAIAPPPR